MKSSVEIHEIEQWKVKAKSILMNYLNDVNPKFEVFLDEHSLINEATSEIILMSFLEK